MNLTFEKWHGCANDFAVVWISDRDGDIVIGSLKRQAEKLCDRHRGIGADGLLVLHTKTPDEVMPYRLTIVNSDGSLASNCGNGLRCASLSVRRKHEEVTNLLPEAIELNVEGDIKRGTFFPKKVGDYPYVAVEMGVPILGADLDWHDAAVEASRVAAKQHGLKLQDVFTASVSNNHIVLVVDQAAREQVLAVGPALQSHEAWDGINVHIVSEKEVTDSDQTFAGNAIGGHVSEAYDMFVWERGAGETMACGSGACSVAAVILEQGLTERSDWMALDMPGGRVYVKQENSGEPVVLAGPAQHIYDGTIVI